MSRAEQARARRPRIYSPHAERAQLSYGRRAPRIVVADRRRFWYHQYRMRFLVFADLHLDSPFAWVGKAAGSAWRQRLRETLLEIARAARDHRVDAVLCAGDLYEHDRFTPDTSAFVRGVFEQLAPIPVYVAPGNHDWHGPESMWARNQWSHNVHVFEHNHLRPVALADGLTLWGAAHRAPASTGGFLDAFRVNRGGVNLALFHGSEQGWLAAQGVEKIPHAPFAAADVERAGIHHAFVGHYHNPRDADYFTYPGNPDALSFGEEGDRGAVLAVVSDDGAVARQRIPVGRTQLHDLRVDVTGACSQQDVRGLISKVLAGRSGIARVTLAGELAAEVELRPGELRDAPRGIEKLDVRIGDDLRVAYDFDAIAAERTVRGEFVREVTEAKDLDDRQRCDVLVIGLRALEGREDLEAL